MFLFIEATMVIFKDQIRYVILKIIIFQNGKHNILSQEHFFLNHITTCRDTRHNAIITYFDLCKAFDKVPHQRLIKKT